jgi:serine/threonine protein kinase
MDVRMTTSPKIHHYTFLEKIGSGRFGTVYRGSNDKTGESVAIKLERVDAGKTLNILKHETTLLNYLYTNACRNIPYIYWYGRYADCPALVMPYYDCSLFGVFSKSAPPTAHSFSPHRIVYSIIQIIQTIHTAGVVHRDLKPHNFMLRNAELFLIDFGMATFYVDENREHIAETPAKTHLLGTLKYISYHIHCGSPYTRRDDLISIGYIYMFICGFLYWDRTLFSEDMNSTPEMLPETHILYSKNQCMKTLKKLDRIKAFFEEHCLEEPSIVEYIRYSYGLGFAETPNYEHLLATIANAIDG